MEGYGLRSDGVFQVHLSSAHDRERIDMHLEQVVNGPYDLVVLTGPVESVQQGLAPTGQIIGSGFMKGNLIMFFEVDGRAGELYGMAPWHVLCSNDIEDAEALSTDEKIEGRKVYLNENGYRVEIGQIVSGIHNLCNTGEMEVSTHDVGVFKVINPSMIDEKYLLSDVFCDNVTICDNLSAEEKRSLLSKPTFQKGFSGIKKGSVVFLDYRLVRRSPGHAPCCHRVVLSDMKSVEGDSGSILYFHDVVDDRDHMNLLSFHSGRLTMNEKSDDTEKQTGYAVSYKLQNAIKYISKNLFNGSNVRACISRAGMRRVRSLYASSGFFTDDNSSLA